jgi:DNA invertase Pin-like site-specific DNA recombinase
MKRAVLYLRVSTDEQSCDMQERDLRRLAEQRGLEIVQVYRDEGWSGAKASRPAFDEMLRDAKRGRFSVLLTWKLDRLGRSLSNLLRLLEDLRTWNVGLVSYSESLDLDSPSGRLMYQLISAFSEYEREIIRSRVRAGLRNARAKGKTLGRPRVAVDAAKVASLRAQGRSWRAVARELKVNARTARRAVAQTSRTAAPQVAESPAVACQV